MATHTNGPNPADLVPQNVEAEEAVLGSILLDPDVLPDVEEILSPHHFWRDGYRRVYETMLALRKGGSAIDLVTVYTALSGVIDDIGGVGLISGLADRVPSAANATHYARLVLEAWFRRAVITYTGSLAALAYSDLDIATVMTQATSMLRAIDEGSAHDDVTPGALALERWHASVTLSISTGIRPGTRTGFAKLDEHIVGVMPGELVSVIGASGMSKSAFLLELAMRLIAQGRRVLYVSLEMPEEQLIARLLASRTGIDTRLFRAHFMDDSGVVAQGAVDRVMGAYDEVYALVRDRLYWRAIPTTEEKLRALTLRMHDRGQCDVVLVDYLGLLNSAERTATTYERVSNLAKALKSIAMEARVPVVTLAQINRAADGRENPHPRLSDARDSGVTIEASDFVWGLFRASYYDSKRAVDDAAFREHAELLILKARDGVAHATIDLRFIPHSTTYADWPSAWPIPRNL